eukprot:CAMPEP_0171485316 /NCGR_PEP_ID=MMETSP0958-20121227/472_1 /TAXON_ID=87120 /ORGANISM="Aurantiochytrium limacinum, Strain ATCCMYA-1381" /LENGTH=825 /DNA_ID=CAMNT_0012018081 /DNA_START=329 /DNA_END=2806 /DNA_ORIENTATION=-
MPSSTVNTPHVRLMEALHPRETSTQAVRVPAILGFCATGASLALLITAWRLAHPALVIRQPLFSHHFSRLVAAAIGIQATRLGQGFVLLVLQLLAILQTKRLARLNGIERGSRPFVVGTEELAAAKPGSLSLHLWLALVLSAGLLLGAAEIALAVLLTILSPLSSDLSTNKAALGTLAAALACMWVGILMRLGASALCMRWQGAFGTDRLLWFTHYRLRVSATLRWLMCAFCCRWDYMCGRRASEPVLKGRFDQDELTGAATMMAYVLNYRSLGLKRFEMLGLLSKLLYDEAKRLKEEKEAFLQHVDEVAHETGQDGAPRWSLQRPRFIVDLLRREARVPPQPDLGLALAELLEKALDLNRFAIAAYTGMLLDAERSWCCYILQWYHTQGIFCPCKALPHRHQGHIKGDNCVQGHRTKFLNYLAEEELVLHEGRVGQGACRVAYQLVSRHPPGKQAEIVLAIRGTEDVHDMITDSLMWPCHLDYEELGLPVGAHVHLGVLLCVRNLFAEVAPVLEKVAASDPNAPVWIVGHSLGASVAALFTVAVRDKSETEFPHLGGARAMAYQPLPCLDSIGRDHVDQVCPDAILSLPFADDIVSRLSLQRLHRLSRRVEAKRQDAHDGALDKAIRNRFVAAWYSFRFGILVPLGCLWKGRDRISRVEDAGLRAKIPRRRVDPENQAQHQDHGLDYKKNSAHWRVDNYDSEDDDVENDILNASNDGFGQEDTFVYPRLYVVGKIVHIQRHRLPEGTPAFIARPCLPQSRPLQDIILSNDMFVDHMPWRLASALADVLGYSFERPPYFHRAPRSTRMHRQEESQNAGEIELMVM